MFDSVRPHRRQPTRLPLPWDSPGKNTRVGCHFLLQCIKVKSESEVTQSCLTLSDPMDCRPPGSSVHGIFQARALEWGAIAFSFLYLGVLFIIVNCNLTETIYCDHLSLNNYDNTVLIKSNSAKRINYIIIICSTDHTELPMWEAAGRKTSTCSGILLTFMGKQM